MFICVICAAKPCSLSETSELFLSPRLCASARVYVLVVALSLGGAAIVALAGSTAGQSVASTNSLPLRFGVSARTMADLNRTDVTAALKVWFETIAKERGINADPNPRVFDSLADFAEALQREEIDVITAPSDEFIVLEKDRSTGGVVFHRGGRVHYRGVCVVSSAG